MTNIGEKTTLYICIVINIGVLMTAGLSLSAIRTKYNIPANISDSEVMSFARDNNITISFSSKGNKPLQSQPRVANGNPFSGSIMTQGKGQITPPQAGISWGGKMTPAVSKGTSIFGERVSSNTAKTGGLDDFGSIEGFSIERSAVTAPQEDLTIDTTSFNNWLKQKEVKEKAKSNKPSFDTRVDATLEQITGGDSSLIQSRKSQDGKCIVTLADGRIVEIARQKGDEGFDASLSRSDVAYKIYGDGKVTIVGVDGKTKERLTVNGELGYQKKG